MLLIFNLSLSVCFIWCCGSYRGDYIKELCKRYDGDDEGLISETQPSWCLSNDEIYAALSPLHALLIGKEEDTISGDDIEEVNSAVRQALVTVDHIGIDISEKYHELLFAGSNVSLSCVG